MNPEELLKPRFKVIGDFPFNSHAIGEIIIDPADDYYSEGGPLPQSWPLSSMPHLFKKLSWWEDRRPEDMPEYVKHINNDRIEKAIRWCIKKQLCYVVVDHTTWDLSYTVPVTESEYIKSKTP